MNALLLVAHGSRREQSNEEIRTLAGRLAVEAGDSMDIVDSAFLELAKPSIPEGIEKLAARGATSILVVPYFLACGTHVADDIPEEVEKGRLLAPETQITISNYIGASAAMPRLLLALAQES